MKNIITSKSLNFVFDITKYLYFNVEIDQEVKISAMSKPSSREMFTSALDYIIDRNLCLLGGFRIYYTDESREAIKKVPHILLSPTKGKLESNKVLPFEFKKTPKGELLVLTDKYLKLFEYGNPPKNTA